MFRKKKSHGSPKMLALDIGENDPIGNKLVSIEMDQVAKTRFKSPRESRKPSIERIFGKMVKVDTDNDVIAARVRSFLSPKSSRKSFMPCSPTALTLESEEGAPGPQFSMKAYAQRKVSYTPKAHRCRPHSRAPSDQDCFEDVLLE
jgi:hypothetical protein